MRKVFWENPYQTKLTTQVTHVDGSVLLFADTIIYSFVGGQESDKATITKLSTQELATQEIIPILDSKIVDDKIYYTVPENHELIIGDTIVQTIDWPRRSRLMRLHFAAELILELVSKNYNLPKIGAHISEHKSRIDFATDENISTYFPAILHEYNQIISDDKIIHKDFSDIENQRRYWKIDGFAQVPCGGTHVRSTGEVGFIKLKRERLGKSKERIEITLLDDSVPANNQPNNNQ